MYLSPLTPIDLIKSTFAIAGIPSAFSIHNSYMVDQSDENLNAVLNMAPSMTGGGTFLIKTSNQCTSSSVPYPHKTFLITAKTLLSSFSSSRAILVTKLDFSKLQHEWIEIDLEKNGKSIYLEHPYVDLALIPVDDEFANMLVNLRSIERIPVLEDFASPSQLDEQMRAQHQLWLNAGFPAGFSNQPEQMLPCLGFCPAVFPASKLLLKEKWDLPFPRRPVDEPPAEKMWNGQAGGPVVSFENGDLSYEAGVQARGSVNSINILGVLTKMANGDSNLDCSVLVESSYIFELVRDFYKL